MNISSPPDILAIGQFDGIHLGHQAVLRDAVAAADALHGSADALTFSPHVASVLNPANAPQLLSTPAQNLRHMRACGIRNIHVMPFSMAIASLSPEVFLSLIARTFFHAPGKRDAAPAAKPNTFQPTEKFGPSFRTPRPKTIDLPHVGKNIPSPWKIVVGHNFTFGRDRAGDYENIADLAARAGMDTDIIPPVEWDGLPVSSTRIRNAITNGDLPAAAAMLGRPFALEGTIVHGRAHGRTRGRPTANLRPDLPIRPAPGVYAARLLLGPEAGDPNTPRRSLDGAAFVPPHTPLSATDELLSDIPSLSPFGFNPGDNPSDIIEIHIPAWTGDLYGRHAAIAFLSRLRPPRTFSSDADADAQIQTDIQEALHACSRS